MRNTLTLLILLCASLRTLAVQVVVSANPARCGLNNGSAIASVSGGIPPYAYSWSNGATSASINGLAPGDYTVTVTDGLSNTDQATATVTAVFQMGDPGFPTLYQPDCQGMCTGIVVSSPPSGGAEPYVYPPFVTDNGFGQVSIMGLCANLPYMIDVTDAFGCPGSIQIQVGTVSEVAPSTVQVQGTTPACQGQNNGSMTILLIGTSPCQIAVTRVGGGYSQNHYPGISTPYIITNLPSGDYNLNSSALGPWGPLCSLDFTATVPEIPAPCGGVSGRV